MAQKTISSEQRLNELFRRADESYTSGKLPKAGRGYERAYDKAMEIGAHDQAKKAALLGALSYERAAERPNVAIVVALNHIARSSWMDYYSIPELPEISSRIIEMNAKNAFLQKALHMAELAGDDKRTVRLSIAIEEVRLQIDFEKAKR